MKALFGDFSAGRIGIALLILRVVTGAGMMIHGWGKIQNPFTWMNKNPDAPAGFIQALAALGEFGGGLGLIVGCLTPLAALGVMCTMIGAIFIGHAGDPWINLKGGRTFEMASLYLLLATGILLIGPGAYSLDKILFGRERTGRGITGKS